MSLVSTSTYRNDVKKNNIKRKINTRGAESLFQNLKVLLEISRDVHLPYIPAHDDTCFVDNFYTQHSGSLSSRRFSDVTQRKQNINLCLLTGIIFIVKQNTFF